MEGKERFIEIKIVDSEKKFLENREHFARLRDEAMQEFFHKGGKNLDAFFNELPKKATSFLMVETIRDGNRKISKPIAVATFREIGKGKMHCDWAFINREFRNLSIGKKIEKMVFDYAKRKKIKEMRYSMGPESEKLNKYRDFLWNKNKLEQVFDKTKNEYVLKMGDKGSSNEYLSEKVMGAHGKDKEEISKRKTEMAQRLGSKYPKFLELLKKEKSPFISKKATKRRKK